MPDERILENFLRTSYLSGGNNDALLKQLEGMDFERKQINMVLERLERTGELRVAAETQAAAERVATNLTRATRELRSGKIAKLPRFGWGGEPVELPRKLNAARFGLTSGGMPPEIDPLRAKMPETPRKQMPAQSNQPPAKAGQEQARPVEPQAFRMEHKPAESQPRREPPQLETPPKPQAPRMESKPPEVSQPKMGAARREIQPKLAPATALMAEISRRFIIGGDNSKFIGELLSQGLSLHEINAAISRAASEKPLKRQLSLPNRAQLVQGIKSQFAQGKLDIPFLVVSFGKDTARGLLKSADYMDRVPSARDLLRPPAAGQQKPRRKI